MNKATPIDLHDLEHMLLEVRDALKEINMERAKPNYLGTPGARMTLKLAREIAANAQDKVNRAAKIIDASMDDSTGIYHLVSPIQFGIKRSTAIIK